MLGTKIELEELIDSTVTVPTVPTTLLEINRIFEDPEGSTAEAASVINRDPAIATKVLRIANNSFYGMRHPVSSIQLATSILGLRVLKSLVVQATVLDKFGAIDPVDGFSAEWLWDHSFKVACAAKLMSQASSMHLQILPEDAYTCGLLHDIGQILLMAHVPAEFARALTLSQQRGVPHHLVERELFGFTHAQVGAVLCQRWKLGPTIVAAVLCHHEELMDNQTAQQLGQLIGQADAMAMQVDPGPRQHSATEFSTAQLESWGFDAAMIQRIIDTVTKARLTA
jgi:putative nucleotidyltransferase with HDIG domain